MKRPPQIPPTLLAVALIVLLAAAGCGEGATANDGSSAGAAASGSASTPPSTATPAGGTTGAGGGNEQNGTSPPGSASPTSAATQTPTAANLQKQFPPADHLNKIVSAYTVASENPELLTGLPCYCPCELYGHGGVIDCHRSQHAAMCDVCMNEAIEANDLYQAQIDGGQPGDIAAAQAAVKDRYRRALVQQTAQRFPGMNTQQGQAFLQACSDCHQPPSPAMHVAGDWDTTLTRMEEYARGSNAMPDQAIWDAAEAYVKSVAGQVPAATVAQMRQSLDSTVAHLKETEGDAAYYPSVRDDVLDPAWAVRMSAAYNAAREMPAELLAATPTTCKPCTDAGNTNLLACLNSWQAITCETAIEEIEALAAQQASPSQDR